MDDSKKIYVLKNTRKSEENVKKGKKSIYAPTPIMMTSESNDDVRK